MTPSTSPGTTRRTFWLDVVLGFWLVLAAATVAAAAAVWILDGMWWPFLAAAVLFVVMFHLTLQRGTQR